VKESCAQSACWKKKNWKKNMWGQPPSAVRPSAARPRSSLEPPGRALLPSLAWKSGPSGQYQQRWKSRPSGPRQPHLTLGLQPPWLLSKRERRSPLPHQQQCSTPPVSPPGAPATTIPAPSPAPCAFPPSPYPFPDAPPNSPPKQSSRSLSSPNLVILRPASFFRSKHLRIPLFVHRYPSI
jgi:hypothetical protein